MADFALRARGHETRGCLDLGPPMAPGLGVEADDPGNEFNWTNTKNGCYESTYWRFALGVAQAWRMREGQPADPGWALVAETLCTPLVHQWRDPSNVPPPPPADGARE